VCYRAATATARITLAAEQQIRIEREAEGDRKTAVMHAEKELAVERIRSEKLIAEKQAQRDLHAIEDDMMVARLKSQADAAHHAAAKQAEADKLLLTPDFLRLQQVCLGVGSPHVGCFFMNLTGKRVWMHDFIRFVFFIVLFSALFFKRDKNANRSRLQ
jgi:hypothetical protein